MGLVTKLFLLTILVALVTSKPPQFADFDPTELPPWLPTWVECEFNYTEEHHGPTCLDCSSTIKCTPVGGIVINCFRDDALYCNDGECSSEPSEQCLNPEGFDVEDQLIAY